MLFWKFKNLIVAKEALFLTVWNLFCKCFPNRLQLADLRLKLPYLRWLHQVSVYYVSYEIWKVRFVIFFLPQKCTSAILSRNELITILSMNGMVVGENTPAYDRARERILARLRDNSPTLVTEREIASHFAVRNVATPSTQQSGVVLPSYASYAVRDIQFLITNVTE